MKVFQQIATAAIAVVATSASIAADGPADISLLAEIIEIDAASASRILQDQPSGPAARAEGDRLIETGSATLIECLFVRAAPGEAAAIKSVEELQFGTEGDPPELPNTLNLEGETGATIEATDSTFTAFEMREVGISWEVDPTLAVTASRTRKHEPGVWVRKRKAPGDNRDAEDASEETAPKYMELSQKLDWVELQSKDFAANRPGVTPDKHPNSHKWHPRIRSTTQGNPVHLAFGKPALIACVESPLNKNRYVMIFFTAWHLDSETPQAVK